MQRLTLDQLKELAQHTASPSVSIFLPTHRTGQDIQQDPIRFKNLLREAEKQFLDKRDGASRSKCTAPTRARIIRGNAISGSISTKDWLCFWPQMISITIAFHLASRSCLSYRNPITSNLFYHFSRTMAIITFWQSARMKFAYMKEHATAWVKLTLPDGDTRKSGRSPQAR